MNEPLPKLVDYLKMDFTELDRQLYTLSFAHNDAHEDENDLAKRGMLIKTLMKQRQYEEMIRQCKAGVETILGTYVPPQKITSRKTKGRD